MKKGKYFIWYRQEILFVLHDFLEMKSIGNEVLILDRHQEIFIKQSNICIDSSKTKHIE